MEMYKIRGLKNLIHKLLKEKNEKNEKNVYRCVLDLGLKGVFMMDDRYKKVEGLLFSYKSLPYRKKCLEIDLEIEPGNEEKREELRILELTIKKIDSMLDVIRSESEIDYLVLKMWYIDRMTWEQISEQLHMSVQWLIKKRRRLIIDKFLGLI